MVHESTVLGGFHRCTLFSHIIRAAPAKKLVQCKNKIPFKLRNVIQSK